MTALDIPDLDDPYLVKYAMERLGMNQRELADLLGYDRSTVAYWRTGKIGVGTSTRKLLVALMLQRQAALIARRVATGASDYYSLKCLDSALLVNEKWLYHVQGCSRCMARILYDAGKVTPI